MVRIDGGFTYPFKWKKRKGPYLPDGMPPDKRLLRSKTMPQHNTKGLFLLRNADLIIQSGLQLSESGRTRGKNIWTKRHTNYERRQST